jgi:hypothetical protein
MGFSIKLKAVQTCSYLLPLLPIPYYMMGVGSAGVGPILNEIPVYRNLDGDTWMAA